MPIQRFRAFSHNMEIQKISIAKNILVSDAT